MAKNRRLHNEDMGREIRISVTAGLSVQSGKAVGGCPFDGLVGHCDPL